MLYLFSSKNECPCLLAIELTTMAVRTKSQDLVAELFAKIKTNPTTPTAIRAMYAIRKVFPPRKNINKFIAGGAVEEVMTELIQSCGHSCANVSSTETLIDILVTNGDETFPFSLKSIQRLGSAVVLENYRGQKREISDLAPTILVILGESTLTLAYLDNDLVAQSGVPRESVYTHADSNLSMKGKFAKTMITSTLPREFVVDLPVPPIPDLAEEDISRLAVARVRELLK
jgi:hypothetical protein